MSPQFDTSRQIFDANFALLPVRWGTLRLGYGHEGSKAERPRLQRRRREHLPCDIRHIHEPMPHASRQLRHGMAPRRGFVETGIDYEEGPGGASRRCAITTSPIATASGSRCSRR